MTRINLVDPKVLTDKHLDPDCSYSDWRNVAMALKHYFHDDDGLAHLLFDQWSQTGTCSAKGMLSSFMTRSSGCIQDTSSSTSS